jgi:hypothetical protein
MLLILCHVTAVVDSVAVVEGCVAVSSLLKKEIFSLTYNSTDFTKDESFSRKVFFDCNS